MSAKARNIRGNPERRDAQGAGCRMSYANGPPSIVTGLTPRIGHPGFPSFHNGAAKRFS